MSALLAAFGATLVLMAGALTAGATAIFALSPSQVRTLVEEGFTGARALARLQDRPGLPESLSLLATVLRLVGMGMGAAATAAAGQAATLLALPVLVIGVLFVGRQVPLGLAARFPVRVALAAAPLLLPVERPVHAFFGPWVRLGDWVSARGAEGPSESDERIVQDMTRLGREEGVVDIDEHRLVERAFRLDELTAWDVMTPRVDVFAWSEDLTLGAIVGQLPSVPYSRVPLYRGSVDEVTGVLYVREAYATYVAGDTGRVLKDAAREPLFVPGSLSLSQLLRAFQTRRIHMAVVADEFGGTDGIVTLEDVLEELVGEIVDETDVQDEPILTIAGDELVADASVDLRDINQALGTTLPQDEHRSLNGFILEELGRVPDPGETLDAAGVHVEILEATDTHVVKVRVRRIATAASTGDEERDTERHP